MAVVVLHGINADILHRWRESVRPGDVAIDAVQRDVVPVAVAPSSAVPARDGCVAVERRRGTLTMKIAGPMGAPADLAARTRELLR